MILNTGTPKKVSLIVGNPDVLFISGTPHRSCLRDTAQLQLQVSHEVPREVQASRSSLSLRIHMRYRGYMKFLEAIMVTQGYIGVIGSTCWLRRVI